MSAIGAKESGVVRAAVIGAGSMGGGIAAQFANAGIPVDLLDIPGKDGARNGPAEAGLARQLKTGGFMAPGAAALVRTGNTEDDLDRLAGADWIVEAIIENLDAKRDLYARLDKVRKPGCIVSSNTSTIPRAALVEGMGEGFARDFVITHFFNPPRVMKLVEIVSAPGTDPGVNARVHAAARAVLGKTVVDCRDTPGFIANRIGCFWMAAGALEAMRAGITVELADAVNAAFGIPRTGVFGLFDLVGIDLVPHVWGSLMAALPDSDALHEYDLPGDALFSALVASGRAGRKSGAGFYRKAADGTREALDLSSDSYRAQVAAEVPGGGRDLDALLGDGGAAGRYARALLAAVIGYAAEHAPELADDVAAVDTAIALGYSWRQGPFALADRVGPARVAEWIAGAGRPVPPLLARAVAEGGFFAGGAMASAGGRSKDVAGARLADQPVLFVNAAATLHDIGDGVACFRIHTKMNSFAPEVFDVLDWTLAHAGGAFKALVLGNDDPRAFSAGADLSFILGMIDSGGTAAVEAYITRGQALFLAMRRAGVPVVAAAHGFALGGGCEFLLHAHAAVAHAELNAGLPETRVGLIPAWGGCTTLLQRAPGAGGPVARARAAFDAIFPGTVGGSALQAQGAGLLRPDDGIVMHRDDLLPAAKARALAMLEAGHRPGPQPMLQMAGPAGKAGLMATLDGERSAGRITATDHTLGEALATVLTGGAEADLSLLMTEEEIMALERAALLDLATRPEMRARMDHMLKTGKPLRN